MLEKTCFNETYDIICHMDSKLYQKIPINFLNFIKQNMIDNYEVNIDYQKGINNQELQKDTRTLLALIYRDYLCNEEKKNILLEKDKLELEKIEKENKEKYNHDILFNKKQDNQPKKIEDKQEEIHLIEIKNENIFQKIIHKIKNFFRKDR